jgi:RNA polymerase sigma-70 factor (ECF subfamily)
MKSTEADVVPETDALLDILDRHGAELYALLTRLTLRADAAEDLLQDLFLRLRSSTGFARAADRKGYAFRTAVNLAFDWRRSRREPESLQIEPPAGGSSPLEHMIDREDLEQVLDAMDRITPLGREVLVMRFLQHADYAAIAQQVGKTEHQVRGICSKALGQLRAELGFEQPIEKKGPMS